MGRSSPLVAGRCGSPGLDSWPLWAPGAHGTLHTSLREVCQSSPSVSPSSPARREKRGAGAFSVPRAGDAGGRHEAREMASGRRRATRGKGTPPTGTDGRGGQGFRVTGCTFRVWGSVSHRRSSAVPSSPCVLRALGVAVVGKHARCLVPCRDVRGMVYWRRSSGDAMSTSSCGRALPTHSRWRRTG